MVRIRFQQNLDDLKEKLLVMAGMAEQSIQRAVEAYRVRDLSICDLVDRGEMAINRLEREIDQMALDLLAMEQPMAVDLRFVLAAIKINSDLERVGDQSMTIALLAEELAGSQPCEFPIDIPRMAELSMTMVRKALQALAERDAQLASSVLAMDDAVDEMNRRAKAVLLDCIAKDSSAAQSAVNLLFISRSLERIADHATNMAEDVIFWVCGADVRHGNMLQNAVELRS
jgi:phosphate transport system protein